MLLQDPSMSNAAFGGDYATTPYESMVDQLMSQKKDYSSFNADIANAQAQSQKMLLSMQKPTGANSSIKTPTVSPAKYQAAVQSATNPSTSAKQAVDIANILDPKLASDFQKELATALPGYQQIVQQMSSQVQDMMSGALPKDVQEQIDMMSAQRNLKGGRYGGIAGNATARDLGLSSLQMSQQGFASAKDLLNLVTTKLMPPSADVSKLFGETNQLSLQQTQLAQQQYQYQSSMDWSQELSNWNKNFEQYATNLNLQNQSQSRTDALSIMQNKDLQSQLAYGAYGASRAQSFM